MDDFKNEILAQFQTIFKDVVAVLPTLFKLMCFFLIAWIIIKIILFILKKVLVKSKVDKWSEKLSETKIFGNTTINVVLSKLILGVVKWFLILIFVMAGSNMFGLTTVSDGIRSFFAYLPRLITALAIFGGGVYLGTVVKKAIASVFKSMDISGGNVIGNIIFYLLVVFTSITALDQAGIDTSIIKQNVTLLLGSILLAFTIAFGLGAREPVARLLFGYYSRKNVRVGSKIKMKDVEGVVIAIDNICMVVQTEKGKVVIPIQEIVDNRIEILG